jgi:putative membrane protein
VTIADLPAVNATLNATSALLLGSGWVFIRRRQIARHRACMIAAFAVSSAFLASYLYYHYYHGATPFPGTGPARVVYFTVLVSHVLLAFLVPPLALVSLYRAWRGRFLAHRRIAVVTFPIWMYVSVTGVVVYWMLYRVYG